MEASRISTSAILCGLLVLLLLPRTTYGQQIVTSEPPAPQTSIQLPHEESCPTGKRGGAIGGIVVGSALWWLLPMSIPVLITQARKLKAHNWARLERRCQYAPR